MKKLIFFSLFSFCIVLNTAAQNDQNGTIISSDDGSFISIEGDSSMIKIGSDSGDVDSLYQEEQVRSGNKDTEYTVEQVPNPKTTDNTYVSDPDHYLKQETIDQINNLLYTLEGKTTDQVAVVVLNSIGQQVPKTFAYELFNKWGIGIKGKDNGLLILMIMDQRRVEFETGYGMESMLPDAICNRIQQNYMVPEFKKENYDQGLLEGVRAAVDILSNPENSKIAAELKEAIADEKQEERFGVLVAFFSFYFLFALIFYMKKRQDKSFKKNSKEPGAKELAAISQRKWLILYILLPIAFGLYLYFFYSGNNFMITFLLGYYIIAMLLFIEKRIRLNRSLSKTAVEGNYYENYIAYKESHSKWWLAVLGFPFLFLFYLIYMEIKKRSLRNHPRNCKSCSHPLLKLSETEDDQHLKKTQILEEGLRSIDYDVWLCNACGKSEVYAFANSFSRYSVCKGCKVKASYLFSNKTLVSATYSSSGTGCKTYKCKNCSYQREETYTIPMKVESSSSSGSSGGGGGSFGGGSSGGGGSGSSW